MKTKIKEALKTKYKALGFSDAAIEAVASFLEASVTEETGIDAAVAGVEGLLKAVQSDSDKARADKAKAEAKLAELEKAHPAPATTPAPALGKPDEAEPTWAKSMRERNEALEVRLNAIDGDKVASSRKKQLATVTAKADEAFQKHNEKILGRMNFTDDEDFTSYLAEVQTATDAFVAAAALKGSTFGRPLGGSGKPGDKPSPEVEARIKAREAETVIPAITGLPQTK